MANFGVINADWLNENALRNYPLVDGASRISDDNLVLPNGLLVDLSMPVPIGTMSPGDGYIHSVVGFDTGLLINFADRTDPTTVLATATVFTATHELNKSYQLVGTGALEGAIGRVTVGTVDAVEIAVQGRYEFDGNPGNTLLVVSAIRPLLRGVNGVRVQSAGGALSDALGGNVVLEAGDNIELSVNPLTNTVTISSGLLETAAADDDDCGCVTDSGSEGPAIRRINGVGPDSNGNFTLSVFECTELTPIANGLIIDDSCAEPCCDCTQLEALQLAIQVVETEVGNLQEIGEQLRGRIDNLAAVMAQSSLNPPTADQDDGQGQTYFWLPGGRPGSGEGGFFEAP